jgi:adenine-specific DNA-methyltransferase
VSPSKDTRGIGVEPTGRLELTWTNKHLRLITTEQGGYTWVDPSDPRVSEVRLLHHVESVGEVAVDGPQNLLIEGDALHALTALNRVPELARQYVGKVRLVYIDPPFNTRQAFTHYDDNLEHSMWLSMLRDRLVQIKPLLAPNGSIWVHLDDAEVHRCRCVMDEVLGAANFVASIVWRKTHSRENRTDVSTIHENLLLYARDRPTWAKARNRLPATPEVIADYVNLDDDPRGPWKRTPAHAKAEKGRRQSQYYDITTPSGRVVRPPEGRCWLYTEERFKDLVNDGRVWFGRSGTGVPRIKKFLSEVDPGLVPTSIWSHEEVGTTGEGKQELVRLFPGVTPFSTPKPERLIRRIIDIASSPGDVVLDAFGGSGTTAAVAHKMNRRWVTSEREEATVEQFTRPRLEKVVAGEDPGGITSAVDWAGGGGFQHVRVGPSMFDFDEESGHVFLADWATNGAFSAAVAAQLGFEFVDDQPFCGTKGRTRLAVLDGVVGEAEIEYLVASLGDRERMVVVGKAVTDDAEATLRKLLPGSRLRFAPDDLMRLGGRR